MRALGCAVLLVAAPATGGPLERCMTANEHRMAARQCLELHARAASGDLAAASDAATEAAARLADVTGREDARAALVASDEAFEGYVRAECGRRAAFMDAGTGAGDAALACRAELRGQRATTLWGEVGGRPASADDLRERAWQLVAMDGRPPLDDTAPDLTLAEDGRAGGNASTNRWFAPFRVDGLGIAFGVVGATQMFNDTPPGRMAQEAGYVEALQDVVRWRLVDGRLQLLDGQTVRLEFE